MGSLIASESIQFASRLLRGRSVSVEAPGGAVRRRARLLDADAEGSFGGGLGEAQFASFLRQEQARMMVEKGGIGLSEALFRAMGGGVENA